MGCGITNKPNVKESVSPPKVSTPAPISQKTVEPLIWLKVNEAMHCSKCNKSSYTFFSSPKENCYLCTSCCPPSSTSSECPNSHPLMWGKTTPPKPCSVCEERDTAFYLCSQCDYKICTSRCKPRIGGKSIGQCPNAHDLKWHKDAEDNECEICGTKGGPGYLCELDGYFVCSGQCRKIKAAQLCPNGHMLEWHKVTHSRRCDVCGRRDDQIYECKGCEFTTCHFCKENKQANKLRTSKDKYGGKNIKQIIKQPAMKEQKVKTPLKTYENKSKVLKSSVKKTPEQYKEYNSSPPKLRASKKSRVKLQEMSNLVESLLEQNASMQASLATVINRSQSVEKIRELSVVDGGGGKRIKKDRSKVTVKKNGLSRHPLEGVPE